MTADVYVLANNRSQHTVSGVLQHFVPNRVPTLQTPTGKYQYWNDLPEADQTTTLFDTETELLTFLETQSGMLYRPAFRSTEDSTVTMVALYYFPDDSLVIGLYTPQHQPTESRLLAELKQLLNSNHGYISYHLPPAYGRKAFIAAAQGA